MKNPTSHRGSRRLRRLLPSVLCSALLAACGGANHEVTVEALQVRATVHGEGELYDPATRIDGLVVRPGVGMVVLSLEGVEGQPLPGDTAGVGADEIRFEIPAGTNPGPAALAIDDEGLKLVAEITVLNTRSGTEVMRVDATHRESSATLEPGSYLLRVQSAHRLSTPVPVFLDFGDSPTGGAGRMQPFASMRRTNAASELSFSLSGECPGCDLRGAKLNGMDLRNVNLAGADLTDANLSKSKLAGANLQNAILTHANVRGTDFSGANLTGANLREAYWYQEAIIRGSGGEHLHAAANARLNTNPPDLGLGSNPPKSTACTSSSGAPTGVCPPPLGTQREGVSVCTTERWGEAEIRDLANRAALVYDETIFPGAVLQGKEFGGGRYTPVHALRSGGTLTLSNLNLKGARSLVVDTVSGPAVDQAVQQIIGSDSNILGTGAELSYDMSQAHSMEKLAFDLKAGGGYAGATVEALFKSSRETSKNTLIVKFSQVYYRVAFQPPAPDPVRNTVAGSHFFHEGDLFADPYNEIAPDNPPLYVSSVSYGRQIYLAMTSSADSADLETAFEVAYSGGGAEVKASTGATMKEVMENTRITYVALGGDAGAAAQPLKGKDGAETFELLKRTIADLKVARYSSSNPPYPVSYTLKYLADDTTARMAYSVVYDKKDCKFLAAQAYDLKLRFSKIDDDVHLWMAAPRDFNPNSSVDGMEKILFHGYLNSGSVERNLTEKIGGENERMFVFRLGNGGCGASSLKAELLRDGQTLRSGSWDTGGWWVGCGWQLETRFIVNKSTGAYTPVYSDRLPLN